MFKYFTILFLLLNTGLVAQDFTIRGRVTDAETGEAIPFVNIILKGTTSGTATDFEGYYALKTALKADSLRAMSLGYVTKTKKINRLGAEGVIDFQLLPDNKLIGEVTILAGENPAHPIMRKAIANHTKHDYQKLEGYECEAYTKIQLDIDNISSSIKKRKMFNGVTAIFDTLTVLVGEDGKPNLPVFYSENLSNVYYINNNLKLSKKEIVKASKITGVGVKDGALSSQFTGSSFEEYNFNRNNVSIFDKDFISPVADGAFIIYEFYLLDSVDIDSIKCYKIRIKPKNAQDLAFTGNIWITDKTFAVKQLNLEVTKAANVNFLDNFRIQAEFLPTTADAWFPKKVRTVINFADVTNNTVGLIAKTYSSYKNVVVNQPKDPEFFDMGMQLNEDAVLKDDAYWAEKRHERLSTTDINVMKMIDTVKRLPSIRTVTEIIQLVSAGYVSVNKIDIGPLINTYSFNTIEGSKFKAGFRTNSKFSDEWIFRGYLAYGIRDNRFKYNAQAERILSRSHWTKIGVERRQDIDQIGVSYDYDESIAFDDGTSTFYAAGSQINRFALQALKSENRAWLESEFMKGFTGRVVLQNIDYKHYFDIKTTDGNSGNNFIKDFTTTEIKLQGRIGIGEIYLQDKNRRRQFMKSKFPIMKFSYTQGINKVINSDFQYQKADFSIGQRAKLGIYGYSVYNIGGGKVFSKIPYTLLQIHRGNQTPFFARASYNMMNYFEFLSDEYLELNYEHHFGGLIFNRVPLLKKLKLRELVTFNSVFGNLSPLNANFNQGNQFNTLYKRPYMETSFGIENILKVIRVDFLYRLNYKDAQYKADYRALQIANGVTNPYIINDFGVKFSIALSF